MRYAICDIKKFLYIDIINKPKNKFETLVNLLDIDKKSQLIKSLMYISKLLIKIFLFNFLIFRISICELLINKISKINE